MRSPRDGGTAQALGVGFFVGGVVDVLAITKLDQIVRSAEGKYAEDIREGFAKLVEIMNPPGSGGAPAAKPGGVPAEAGEPQVPRENLGGNPSAS